MERALAEAEGAGAPCVVAERDEVVAKRQSGQRPAAWVTTPSSCDGWSGGARTAMKPPSANSNAEPIRRTKCQSIISH